MRFHRLLLMIAALLTLASCAPTAPAPGPMTGGVAIVVHQADGSPVANAAIALMSRSVIGQPRPLHQLRGTTNSDGYVFLGVANLEMLYDLEVTAEGCEDYTGPYTFHAANQDVPVTLTCAPPVVVLPRLVADGEFLRLETGQPFTWIGATDFNLFGQWLRDPAYAESVMAQRADVGFNAVRVFTEYDVPNIGRLVSAEHADYDAQLHTFCQALARHGLYAELVAFGGHHWRVGPDTAAMVAHWNRLIAVAADETNVTLELANELDNPANPPIPLEQLPRPPPPILASHGSNVQDALPVQPFWSYATYRPGGGEWWRKVGHNAWEDVASKYDVPTVSNETTRFPDSDNSPEHAADAAASCALLAAGCTFHSVRGKSSELWDGDELRDARAWADGAHSVPLEFQRGRYERPVDDAFLRVYRKVLPDGRAWTVEVRY